MLAHLARPSVASTRTRAQEIFATTALALTLLLVWSLTYEYRGLVYDAQIYSVQALAKLRPSLRADLFLQYVSQDRFTIFPSIYAWTIEAVGLQPAALLLTAAFTVWFLYASWRLAATLVNRDLGWIGAHSGAWTAIFLLVITGAHYGAAGVFYICEPFVTARLPAEALIVTALVCHYAGRERTALLLAVAALFIHPLMALPGILLLIGLRLPTPRTHAGAAMGATAAAAASLGVLCLALAAVHVPAVGSALPVMDAAWIEVVRERSHFLFLQMWAAADWAVNARPFVILAFCAAVLEDARSRLLAMTAAVVGMTGLAIAFIASAVGPVAILLQGQAWRWVWIAVLAAIILTPPAATRAWQQGAWGRLCFILCSAAWILPAGAGVACASGAWVLWATRFQLARHEAFGKILFLSAAALVMVWAVVASSAALASSAQISAGLPSLVDAVRGVFGVKLWSVLLVALSWRVIRSPRSIFPSALTCTVLAALAGLLVAASTRNIRPAGSASDIQEFADWRARVPPDAAVFVTNGHDSGSFVWFTLQRNNYLSPGQSAGVVFSRDTASEVERRSQVLLPIADPNWKIRSSLRNPAGVAGDAGIAVGDHPRSHTKYRPLTAAALVTLCADPQLGAVISPDDVGFDSIPRAHPGAYHGWRLYDCDRVRSESRES